MESLDDFGDPSILLCNLASCTLTGWIRDDCDGILGTQHRGSDSCELNRDDLIMGPMDHSERCGMGGLVLKAAWTPPHSVKVEEPIYALNGRPAASLHSLMWPYQPFCLFISSDCALRRHARPRALEANMAAASFLFPMKLGCVERPVLP